MFTVIEQLARRYGRAMALFSSHAAKAFGSMIRQGSV